MGKGDESQDEGEREGRREGRKLVWFTKELDHTIAVSVKSEVRKVSHQAGNPGSN